ncbi:hypothetical protein NDU88_003490, partial [Pleurodeles waltl]
LFCVTLKMLEPGCLLATGKFEKGKAEKEGERLERTAAGYAWNDVRAHNNMRVEQGRQQRCLAT